MSFEVGGLSDSSKYVCISKYWMSELLGRSVEGPALMYPLAPSSACLRGNLVMLVKNSIRLLGAKQCYSCCEEGKRIMQKTNVVCIEGVGENIRMPSKLF